MSVRRPRKRDVAVEPERARPLLERRAQRAVGDEQPLRARRRARRAAPPPPSRSAWPLSGRCIDADHGHARQRPGASRRQRRIGRRARRSSKRSTSMPFGTTRSLSARDRSSRAAIRSATARALATHASASAAGESQRALLRGESQCARSRRLAIDARAGELRRRHADRVGVEVVRVDDAHAARAGRAAPCARSAARCWAAGASRRAETRPARCRARAARQRARRRP